MSNTDAQLKKEALVKHLRELRNVLLFCVAAIFIGFVVIFIGFSELLLQYLSRPLIERNVEIITIGVAEAFIAQMKVSFVAGFVITSPAVFWKIWSFLKPALYPQERFKFLMMFFVILALFITGVLFSYFLVLNIAINFFIIAGENLATPMISLDMYIGMLFNFVIPFGLAFEFPVVLFVLHKLEIITVEGLIKARKYVIFAVFVFATLITPPDFFSQILLAFPMLVLYEISILILRWISRNNPKPVELEEDVEEDDGEGDV